MRLITEANRTQLVLFDVQNRAFGPYLETRMPQAAGRQAEFEALLGRLESAPLVELDELCVRTQELVKAVRPEDDVLRQAGAEARRWRRHSCGLGPESMLSVIVLKNHLSQSSVSIYMPSAAELASARHQALVMLCGIRARRGSRL
jgi:hypothetical protein